MIHHIHFTKMQGTGNDYIYVDVTKHALPHPEQFSSLWSDRHKGIGSDGLVLIGKSRSADFSMRIFNADGSEAMMCGNASRCIGRYVYENKLTTKCDIALQTAAGVRQLHVNLNAANLVESVSVDMGEPQLSSVKQVATPDGTLQKVNFSILNHQLNGIFVGMGNPHLVIFVDDVEQFPVAEIGKILEYHPLFPERINVEFCQPLPDGNLRMRVWERGSGITQACGTGACATTVAAHLCGKSDRLAQVVMDGGTLTVEWAPDGHVYMTGPAERVFEGEITYES